MTASPGLERVQMRLSVTATMRDRLRAICARTNLPMSEVMLEVLNAGLDATRDMALRNLPTERVRWKDMDE